MLKIETPKNKNYCGIVVALQNFVTLPNCDNVKAALIFGNSIIVSKDTQPGEVGIFFPVETALSKEFLSNNNLFRKPEWGNVDETKKGYFEEHGRIKAVKFRGNKSEGFWIPLTSLSYLGLSEDLNIGAEFDQLDGHEICHKYISKRNHGSGLAKNRQGRQARAEDKIVQGQFHFHIDTEKLDRNLFKLLPEMWISISDKWHGTSAVFSHVLVKRQLNWYERLLKYVGVNIQEEHYGYVWSSRRVVKGVDGEEKVGAIHYYSEDIWGIVAKEIEGMLPKGYTIYGEICGFMPDGGLIQKGYHYGCQPGAHKFLVYRITTTNADGKILELSWQQMKDFCAKYGLEMVRELFYGKAKDFYPGFTNQTLDEWQNGFLAHLKSLYVHDQMCEYNNYEVPAEGVVVKVERLDEAESYKCKNFLFLEWESKMLDAGEADIETQESESAPDEVTE